METTHTQDALTAPSTYIRPNENETALALEQGDQALQALREAERTLALSMVSSVSHHVNNPLQQAADAIHLLKSSKGFDKHAGEMVLLLESEMERIVNLSCAITREKMEEALPQKRHAALSENQIGKTLQLGRR